MKEIMFLSLAAILVISCSKSEIEDTNNYGNIPPTDNGSLISKVLLVNDEFMGKKIIVAGNAKDLYIVSFERDLDGKLLTFNALDASLPTIMEDDEGNKWDIFGFAVSGPRLGQRLIPTQSIMGYWFSFATFYPGIEIYDGAIDNNFKNKKIEGSNGWLVPFNEVRSGGVGKDGIPAISRPEFQKADQVTFLENEDLVVGIYDGTSAKAYPHEVLDWHEIVNDGLNNVDYSIIYCPLTGTATAWNRKINGTVTTFGVSGLLYNTNIVPYDRTTNSNWSQLFDVAIFGLLQGKKPKSEMVLETKWETWKALYSSSNVMNFNTGHVRDYGRYPYGNYKTDKSLIFPVKYEDLRLDKKERVHAVIVDGKARVYRFESFIRE